MKVLLIDNGTKHLKKLKELLAGNNVDIYPLFKKYPSFYDYSLIVLSGGSMFAVKNDPDKFNQEMDLIRSAKVPIVGICEGAELIAYTFNSDLEQVQPKVKGTRKIMLTDKSLFNTKSEIEVYEAHHWAIKKLGRKLIGLAKSDTGFEIIKHKERDIYGLQFHPEMLTDKTLGDEIFNKLVTLAKH